MCRWDVRVPRFDLITKPFSWLGPDLAAGAGLALLFPQQSLGVGNTELDVDAAEVDVEEIPARGGRGHPQALDVADEAQVLIRHR